MQEAKVGERTRKQELEDSAARSDSEACSREESNKCKFTAREETVREGDGCMRKLLTKTKKKRTAKNNLRTVARVITADLRRRLAKKWEMVADDAGFS